MTIQLFDQALPADAEATLYAPQLPDGKQNVSDADYGLAIRFYDGKPQGGTVIVPALLGQEPKMTLFLNLNGVEKIASEQTESATSSTTLHIPHNLLRSDQLNELNYTARRLDSSEETYQPPLTIKYNKIPPGIKDEIEGDEGHSKLKLILPQEVTEDGIDADLAAQGVQVYFNYPYCRAYDRISLRCNGHEVHRVVHPDEAPPTPTTQPTTIGLLLDKAFFEAAGDNPQASFDYTVADEITNGADPTSPYSKPIRVVVDLKGTRMAAPDMAEDPDDPTDPSDTIDLNKLGTNDLTVQVHVLEPGWVINDIVRVKYTATPRVGSVVEHVVEAPVTRLPFTHKLMIPNAKVIPDSAVKTFYEQIRGGVVTATSKNAWAWVIQKPVISSMKNSFNVELENGGTVSDNKVMLSGSALKGIVLQVFDGAVLREEVEVGTNYKWQSKFISITEGQHSFTVKEKDGNQFESESWTIERLAFSIDQRQLKLEGFSVDAPWPKTGEDSVGNTGIRLPIGGVPPYDYASSAPGTAPVTAGGKVTGLKNGVATIYVSDQEGETRTFVVAVTNKYELMISPQPLTFPEADTWRASLGATHTYNSTFMRDIQRVYHIPSHGYLWTCGTYGRWGGYISPGNRFQSHTSTTWKNISWCIKPSN